MSEPGVNTRVLGKIRALRREGGRPGGEDMGPAACNCSCCTTKSVRRVWWWTGPNERMNAWLCERHLAEVQS